MKVTKCSSKTELDSYAPASSECWMILAKHLMEFYATSYVHQIPTRAICQSEYDILDARNYAPARRLILQQIKYGPIRHAVNIESIYAGLEKRRLENKQFLGVKWEDNYYEDVNAL